MAPVLYYGPFAPPANGQRIAHETFYRLLHDEADLRHVPIEGLSVPSTGPALSGGRVGAHLRGLAAISAALDEAPGATVYFCAASSPRGLLRDVALVARVRTRAGRIVAHVHSGNYESLWASALTRRAATWLAERLDAYAVPSRTQAERVRPVTGATPVHVVTNVVDPQVRTADADYGAVLDARAADGPLRVLYLSNFIPSKGYLDLLEGAALAEAPLHVTFAGSWGADADRRAFVARVTALGLGDQVALYPPVMTRDGVRDLLGAHHVVALPTSYPSEAQPLSILEGMANGCVPVATPHASIPEYVVPGRTGELVPPGDPAALAGALDRLSEPAYREALSCRARAHAAVAFSAVRALPPLRAALGLPLAPARANERDVAVSRSG